MSKLSGLIKATDQASRIQQKRDWVFISEKTGNRYSAPDWSLSVKKIDKIMINICKENGLNYLEIFGSI